METTEERALFGGAIVASVPSRFIDVRYFTHLIQVIKILTIFYSNFREVPDNQEVLVDEKTDQSLIVELLSMDDIPDSEVIITTNFHNF